MNKEVTYHVEDGVGIIEIDNPPVNALGHAVREGLIDAIAVGEADAAADVLLIIGAGRTFPAGADIREFGGVRRRPNLGDVIERIETATKLTVAAIHGTALGGGMEITLGCDYRIALATAKNGPSGSQSRPASWRRGHAASTALDWHEGSTGYYH